MRIRSLIVVILAFILLIMQTSCGNGGGEQTTKSKDVSSAFGDGASVSVSEEGKKTRSAGDYSLSIKFTPFIPDYPDLGSSGKQLLSARLNAAVAKIGFGGDGANPRFILGPDINLLSKNLTGTAPAKYANAYEVTLMTCDVVNQTIFSSYTFEVKGVGDSPDKAFINAFRDYKLENEEFFKFLVESQKKILGYYEQNCSSFLKEADAQAKLRNYDAAFNILSNIPMESAKCYSTVAAKKADYFQLSLNQNCQSVLASMKAELGKANDPSASGFNEPAMAYYQLIDRQSSCYKEAESLYQSYLRKLNPTAKRNWEFQMQQYQDKLKKIERDDQFKRDSTMENFSYLKHKDEMETKAEVEGNKKLLQKYQYDELPWIRKIFHLGKYDPFDRIEK
jgi:hypothetical protein